MIVEEDVYVYLDDFLSHYGKRGMKWGVRRRGRIERHVKVGKGKGNIIDKTRVHTTFNPIDLAKTRSFKKSAARKGARFERRNERIATGKAKLFKDIIPTYGAARPNDIFPSVRSKAISADQKTSRKRMSSGKEFAIAALAVATGIAVSSGSKALARRAATRGL
jgi:hypothetical protein